MEIKDLAFSLISVFEGCKLYAYWDLTGHCWTIGYGHTKTAKYNMRITQEQAEQLFKEDCDPLFQLVKELPALEAAALISFGYNCGIGALKKLLQGEIKVLEYGNTSGGIRLPGLVSRRRLENALIETSRVNT
jgi:GH24 family phage-related lysozyme (muramidase)